MEQKLPKDRLLPSDSHIYERQEDDVLEFNTRRQQIVSRLFEICLMSLQCLLQHIVSTSVKTSDINVLKRCYSLLQLWGDGHNVLSGYLDTILGRSKSLRQTTLSILTSLCRESSQALIEHIPSDKKDERIQQLCSTATGLCSQTKRLLADGDSDDSDSDSEDESDSDALRHHSPAEQIKDSVQSIKLYTDCLMDLGSTLDCPALESEHKGHCNATSLEQQSARDSYVDRIAAELSSEEGCMNESLPNDLPLELGSSIEFDSQIPITSTLASKQQMSADEGLAQFSGEIAFELPSIEPNIENGEPQSPRAFYPSKIKASIKVEALGVVDDAVQSDGHHMLFCPIAKPDGAMHGHRLSENNLLNHPQKYTLQEDHCNTTANVTIDRKESLIKPDADRADEAQVLQEQQSVAVSNPVEADDRPDEERDLRTTVAYTRTEPISKAKRGLKVYTCESCERSYTRREHFRRHQRTHALESAWVCDISGCGKTFYREDLYQRHCEIHNELYSPISQDITAPALRNQAFPEDEDLPAPKTPDHATSSHDHGHDLGEEAELEPSNQWDAPTPQLNELVTPELVDPWPMFTSPPKNECVVVQDTLAYSSAFTAATDWLNAQFYAYPEAQPKTAEDVKDLGNKEEHVCSTEFCSGCNELQRRPKPNLHSSQIFLAETNAEITKSTSDTEGRLRDQRMEADVAFDAWIRCPNQCNYLPASPPTVESFNVHRRLEASVDSEQSMNSTIQPQTPKLDSYEVFSVVPEDSFVRRSNEEFDVEPLVSYAPGLDNVFGLAESGKYRCDHLDCKNKSFCHTVDSGRHHGDMHE